MTAFDALRETIYAEVATLISQNEASPHFLIELFRQLQLLSTDFLRQRALYAIQDIVARYFAKVTILNIFLLACWLYIWKLCPLEVTYIHPCT
jgi:pericentriolar material 1 protein